MPDTHTFDVLVLGGGSGLTAAHHAAQDGRSVALVDAQPDALGGTCVNRGCIPSKGLVQAAEVMKTIREASALGIHVDPAGIRIDFPALMATVRARRARDAESVRAWVEDAFTPFYGCARFVDDRTIEMGDGTRVRGETVFLCSGARPKAPSIPGLENVGYWTNETVFELDEQPERLVILGGGYIGCEFGHFFSALGTRVDVIDRGRCLLRDDDEVRDLFTRQFGRRVALHLERDATEAVERDGQRGFVLKGDGGEETILGDGILVATGRRPDTEGLGLEHTGVETDEHGWVRVDEHLRTTHPRVHAYGDVIGQAMFKHTSSYEGELAWRNARGEDVPVSYRANPHAVFSDPQIGAVGLTERECREQGLRYRKARKDYDSTAKGRIMGSPPGFAKLLVEEDTGRILGFHMVGPQAVDLIHEVVVAMNAGEGTADLVRRSIHVHPTLPELVRSVFDELA